VAEGENKPWDSHRTVEAVTIPAGSTRADILEAVAAELHGIEDDETIVIVLHAYRLGAEWASEALEAERSELERIQKELEGS
jgi:hypothetical protein